MLLPAGFAGYGGEQCSSPSSSILLDLFAEHCLGFHHKHIPRTTSAPGDSTAQLIEMQSEPLACAAAYPPPRVMEFPMSVLESIDAAAG